MLPNEFVVLSDDDIELKLSLAFDSKKQYFYKIYLKNTDINIGNCEIRLLHNLENEYLGNIEYQIFEQFQGHNYAYKATLLLIQVAEYFNEKNLIITVNPSNIASVKTIEKLNAKFIHIIDVPRDMRLYDKCEIIAVYNWNLERGKIK